MRCYHHNDLDGRCAAAIVKRHMKGSGECCSYLEVNHKDKIDVYEIEPGEAVFVVDFSFKPDVMEQILKKTDLVAWIDHHKTAFEYKHSRQLAGIRDNNFSGCELTWKYLFRNTAMPRAVKLIGDYDKWALKYQPICFEFYEGMKLEDNSPISEIWEKLFSDDMLVDVISRHGEVAIRYRDNYCADIRKAYGYETELEGHRAYATNIYAFGSKGFGREFNNHDLCIAYIHDGRQFTVSLYSEKVDVSEIAKKYDGGGHKGAAGFVCERLPFHKGAFALKIKGFRRG